MSSDTLSTPELQKALLAVSDRVVEAKEFLGRLDAAAGDGDLGATLATGFGAVRHHLVSTEFSDVGALLSKVGAVLAGSAPSTMGTLLGTALMRAGSTVTGTESLDPAAVADMLDAAATGVAERGGVRVGQRTVLDALSPSAEAAREAADRGANVTQTLTESAEAARSGAAATAQMRAEVGRAGWIPDRALGHEDAGAAAWAVLATALAEAVAEHQLPAGGGSPT